MITNKNDPAMTIRKFIVIEIFCILLLSHNMFSQIILQGTVSDNGGEYLGSGAEPVVGALVRITDQTDTSRIFSSYTDQKGKYYIQIIETGIDNDVSKFPNDFRLLQNYPNPFSPTTIIAYELGKPSYIKIEIYNVLGQRVKTLFDGYQSSSGHVIWNATNDMGHTVPAGVYICSMQAAGMKKNNKMLLLNEGHSRNHAAHVNQHIAQISGGHELSKLMSNQYKLEITGENIASYIQRDLTIIANMTVDIAVKRTLTDIDGNVYKTVKIGNQWWMAENLKVIRYRNGESIRNVTSNSEWRNLTTGAYCSYDNNEANVAIYGRVYNWFAVNDKRNIAPEGWHVPSDAEWKQLEIHLGMSSTEADRADWRGTDEGGKLKEAGFAHWISPNAGATNESGFSALPGGYRNYTGYSHVMGGSAYFWSSSEDDTSSAWYRFLYHFYADIYRSYFSKECGFSVRCVKDDPLSPPTAYYASLDSIFITDEKLLELVYSSFKFHDDFYHEDLGDAPFYYESSLSILPLNQRPPHAFGLSTNSRDQALAWSEASATHSAYYRTLQSEQENEKYFQFYRVRLDTPNDVLLSRVHKLSYLDCSMCDSFHPTAMIGKFNQTPINRDNVQTLAQYLWFIGNHEIYGAKALATVVAETADSVKCAIFETQMSFGDWGMPDWISLNRKVYSVSKQTCEIRLDRSIMRTIKGKQN